MVQSAAQWVDYIFPNVPIRQWVTSLPFEIRLLLAYDRDACSATLRCVVREIFYWLRHTAKRELGLSSVNAAYPGGVTVIQRAGGALNANLHFHTALFDGVYVRDSSDELRFHALPAPSSADLEEISVRMVDGIRVLLGSRWLRAFDEAEADGTSEASPLGPIRIPAFEQMPLLGECAAASQAGVELFGPRRGQRQGLLGAVTASADAGRAALKYRNQSGLDLHAGVRIAAHEKGRIENLFRYMLRPALAYDRLELLDASEPARVRLRLSRPRRNGTTHLEMDPLSFIGRLVPLVPPPGMHQVRFHGALGPRSKIRRSIIPPRPERPAVLVQLDLFGAAGGGAQNAAACSATAACDDGASPHSLASAPATDAGAPGGQARLPKLERMTWARLLKRMAGYDMETCPQCQRPLRVVQVILKSEAIRAILGSRTHPQMLGRLRRTRTARGPPAGQLPLTFDVR